MLLFLTHVGLFLGGCYVVGMYYVGAKTFFIPLFGEGLSSTFWDKVFCIGMFLTCPVSYPALILIHALDAGSL